MWFAFRANDSGSSSVLAWRRDDEVRAPFIVAEVVAATETIAGRITYSR